VIDSGYLPGNSFLHRLDPRFKLAILPLCAAAFFFPVSLPLLCCYLAFVLLPLLFFLGPRELWLPIRTILPLLLLILLLTPPFHIGGTVYYRVWGPLVLSSKGIEQTLRLMIRFIGISGLFFLFFRVTGIEELILALRWYRVPFSAALILTIAFRYIPHIAALYRAVSDAHRLRRAAETRTPARQNGTTRQSGRAASRRSGSRGLRRRISRLFPRLVSVTIHAIKTIPSLAMGLESRGLGRNERRSSLSSLPPILQRRKELLLIPLVLIFLFSPLFL